MTGSRFVDITPWPRSEREKLLSFLKLGSVLVGFNGSESQIAVFEVKCVFCPVDWN